MTPADVLTLVQRLLTATQHPDVSRVYTYSGAMTGVGVVYSSDAKAFFSLPDGKVTVEPVDMPEDLGEWKFRRLYALKMLIDALESAKPAGITGWRTVAIDDISVRPTGIELRTETGTVVLRVTSGGPMILDSDPADFADWRMPDLS